MHEPPRNLLRVKGRVGLPDRLEQCFPALQQRTQPASATLDAGSEISTTGSARGGIGEVRLGGDRCHRLKVAGALSPSKPAKYTMKPLRLRRWMAYDERLQSALRN